MRDDICAESTPTTPLLIIDFFDAENPAEPKAVNNLALVVSDDPERARLFPAATTIEIPLQTGEGINATSFNFILNAGEDDIAEPNIDTVVFSYIQVEEYVRKACGFRVIYTTLDSQINPQDDGFWIDELQIINPTIEDETTAHVRIFH